MEGPSLVLLKEELSQFKGKKVLSVSGNTKQPKEDLIGKTLKKIDVWGKVIFITFSGPIVTKTHFMLFGSYRINDPKTNLVPRIQLNFENGVVYFYAAAFGMYADELMKQLDWEVNVLGKDWNEKHVLKLMKEKKDPYLCDLLLDQNLFSGSGNIVKNEVLFNLRRHPLTKLSDLKPTDWKKVVHAVRMYCENFYEWKKKYELRKHWQVYKQSSCHNCGTKLKRAQMGKNKRSTFFCPHCQSKALKAEKLEIHQVLPIKSSSEREARFDH